MEKIKLIENFNCSVDNSDIEIPENQTLIESSNGQKYKCRGIIKNVVVSSWETNRNGRLYPKSLWEKIVRSGDAEGSILYMNHQDDYDTRTAGACWRNGRINENTQKVVADLYCFGEYGQLMLEQVQAGGTLSFSSVGYGNFEEREAELSKYPEAKEGIKIIEWDSYEIQSYGDCVASPSNPSAFVTLDTTIIEESTSTEEKITNKKEESLEKEEKITNKKNINEKDENKFSEVTKMDKIQEMTFKNHVNHVIKLAEDKTPIEAISMLKGIEVPVEMSDVQSKIVESITVYENKIEEARKESEAALKESADKLKEAQTDIEAKDAKIKELEESLEKANAVLSEADITPEDSKILKENYETMKEDIVKFEEERSRLLNNIEILVEDKEKKESDIKIFLSNDKFLKEQLKIAELHIKECEAALKEAGVELEEAEDKDKDEKDEKKDAPKDDEKKDDKEEVKEAEEKKDDKEKDEPKEDEGDKEKDEKEKKEEDIAPECRSEVEAIYESKVKDLPALVEFKEEILESKTGFEAVVKIKELTEKTNESIASSLSGKKTLKESVEIEEYKF
jgi:hypothetical protein